ARSPRGRSKGGKAGKGKGGKVGKGGKDGKGGKGKIVHKGLEDATKAMKKKATSSQATKAMKKKAKNSQATKAVKKNAKSSQATKAMKKKAKGGKAKAKAPASACSGQTGGQPESLLQSPALLGHPAGPLPPGRVPGIYGPGRQSQWPATDEGKESDEALKAKT
ncbi:unnamed protein product, partial [Symbiodinium sp. KB8]